MQQNVKVHRQKCLTITACATQLFLVIAESTPAMSPMWGVHGELFHPQGELRDWSRAGYAAGDKPIPRPAAFSDFMVDWDAVGDGVTDDTEARLYHAIVCIEKETSLILWTSTSYQLRMALFCCLKLLPIDQLPFVFFCCLLVSHLLPICVGPCPVLG